MGIPFAFAVQMAYVRVAEEPYPALMMPRFGWAGPRDTTTLEIEVPEVFFTYSDHTTEEVTERELLAGIPDGHHYVLMNTLLHPTTAPPTRAPPGKYAPPSWLFPGYGFARIARSTPEYERSLRDWLSRRARSIHPGAAPKRCTVEWHTLSYRTDSAARERTVTGRTPLGSVDIDLEPAHAP